jgi:hypothetical protein
VCRRAKEGALWVTHTVLLLDEEVGPELLVAGHEGIAIKVGLTHSAQHLLVHKEVALVVKAKVVKSDDNEEAVRHESVTYGALGGGRGEDVVGSVAHDVGRPALTHQVISAQHVPDGRSGCVVVTYTAESL